MSPWHVMAIILPHLKLIKDNSLKSQLTQKLIAILITTDMTSARGWNGAAAITVPARDVYSSRVLFDELVELIRLFDHIKGNDRNAEHKMKWLDRRGGRTTRVGTQSQKVSLPLPRSRIRYWAEQ